MTASRNRQAAAAEDGAAGTGKQRDRRRPGAAAAPALARQWAAPGAAGGGARRLGDRRPAGMDRSLLLRHALDDRRSDLGLADRGNLPGPALAAGARDPGGDRARLPHRGGRSASSAAWRWAATACWPMSSASISRSPIPCRASCWARSSSSRWASAWRRRSRWPWSWSSSSSSATPSRACARSTAT